LPICKTIVYLHIYIYNEETQQLKRIKLSKMKTINIHMISNIWSRRNSHQTESGMFISKGEEDLV